ncbi:hypothetical protein ACTXT7_011869 [Hymenolepis weldensis]
MSHSVPKISLSGVEEHDKTDEIEGFVRPVNFGACLVLADPEFFVIPKPVHLPSGYNPVFHPQCLGGDGVEETGQEEPLIQEVSTVPLLKPFISNSTKQARFDVYQLLVRQGLPHEEAYERCSSGTPDLTSETRVFEAKVFATLVKNLIPPSQEPSKTSLPPQPSQTPTIPPYETSTGLKQERDNRPLTAGILDSEKQRLVANLLKSRFRSAGEMDITQELTAAQEEERRKDLESLDMTDPRDNAAANEAYGVLTRRTLTWHPASLLCKRFNVPNPYPDSAFLGCPEDRRMRRPPRKGKRRRGDDITSSEFTLFQLLDTNVGDRDENDDGSDYSDETDEEEGKTDEKEATHSSTFETSTKPSSGPPQSIFEALFAQSEKAQREQQNEMSAEKTESVPLTPRILGPAAPLPDISKASTTNEEGVPSMDLFKSIFASDEELEDDDDDGQENDDLAATIQPSPTLESSTEFRKSVVSAGPILHEDESVRDEEKEKAITRPANPPDLSVHQLFKHLFNPEMDNEAPLFAVSKVANQWREERRMEVESDSAVPSSSKGPISEEDLYGPSLPPGFGDAGGSNISTSILVNSTDSSSKHVDYIERKKRKKDDSDREHHSHKRKDKHHHHHKHKRRHHSKRDKN